jgi:type II secretory pathway component PulF
MAKLGRVAPWLNEEALTEKNQGGEAKKDAMMFMSVPLEERVLFARQLSVGIKAGLSMQDSLHLLLSQTKSKSMKKILNDLLHDTANGMYLSASLEKYAQIFGQLFINIVRVGEQSGTLTENLVYLAEELKKKHELVSRVRGALIYPGVILFSCSSPSESSGPDFWQCPCLPGHARMLWLSSFIGTKA